MKMTYMAAVAALAVAGCAVNRPYVKDTAEIEGSKTNYTRIVKGTSVAIWPASQEVHNQKVSVGKTINLGTAGVTGESTGGTNGVAAIQSVERLVRMALTGAP